MGIEGETEKKDLAAEVVARMKASGLSKPDDVTHASWNQVLEMKPNYMTIAYMAASGAKNTEIAESIGMSAVRVGQILQSEKVKLEISRIQHRMFGTDHTRSFQRILPQAIGTAETIMNDENIKPAIRLNAAQDFMDRAVGKATQRVEVGGNLLRQLYEKMDSQSNIIDVGGDSLESILGEESKKFSPETTHVQTEDQWVTENL